MDIAGVVILYKPDNIVAENIASYINEIDILYVVDNTPKKVINFTIVKEIVDLGKIKYIQNNENLGVAYGLNQAAERAFECGYDYLLTMDQDSSFNIDSIREYFEEIKTLSVNKNIAYFSTSEFKNDFIIEEYELTEWKKIYFSITSGSVVSLKWWNKIGGFNDKLFIDEVDHEFCLRLLLNGAIVLGSVKHNLEHNLGTNKAIVRRRTREKDNISVYSGIRYYYMMRNFLFIVANYKTHFPEVIKKRTNFMKRKIKRMFLYEDRKAVKFFYLILGIIHYGFGRFGK